MFEDSLELVLKFEGGYSNDPDDPGGATNFGITQNVYDPTRSKDVKNITPEEVTKIYKQNYWQEGHCDPINTVSQGLAKIHFDNCVNCGVGAAARMLQSILGVKVDGIIGPITLSKVNDTPALRSLYLIARKAYYDRLVEKNPKLLKFRGFWYNRLNRLAVVTGSSFHT